MSPEELDTRRFVVIGAGPAGLTAAYELTKLGLRPIVLEKERVVGGLARTENYNGFYFDMGGHRFFTKVEEVKKMWHEVLGDDFLRRPRLSRIYYNQQVLLLPAQAPQRPCRARVLAECRHRAELSSAGNCSPTAARIPSSSG